MEKRNRFKIIIDDNLYSIFFFIKYNMESIFKNLYNFIYSYKKHCHEYNQNKHRNICYLRIFFNTNNIESNENIFFLNLELLNFR